MGSSPLKNLFILALVSLFAVSQANEGEKQENREENESGSFHFVLQDPKNEKDPVEVNGGYTRLQAPADSKVGPVEIFTTSEPEALKVSEELKKNNPGSHITVIPTKTSYTEKFKNLFLGKKEVRPTGTDVFLGFVNGTIRAGTAGAMWLLVGGGVESTPIALAIASTLTTRTLLRDIFLKRVDSFYSNLSKKVAGFLPGEKPAMNIDGKRTWGEWWKGFKASLTNFAAQQTENLFFAEIVRALATAGGANPHWLSIEGQTKILYSILGPGLAGTYLSIKRAELKSDAAKRWLNLNFFVAGALFQAPSIAIHEGWILPTAVLSHMAFNIGMGKMIHKKPQAFEKWGEYQERAFQKIIKPAIDSCRNLMAKLL